MYKEIESFTPFLHENFESKNQLIIFARTQDKTKVEGVLAATIIYVNLVDYIAQNLLDNLRKMISILGYKACGAVFFYDPSEERKNISLGELKRELCSYSFPDKDSFLNELVEFNKVRNRIMHDLMNVNLKSNASRFDQDLALISGKAESILTKYNTITQGITTIWEKIK